MNRIHKRLHEVPAQQRASTSLLPNLPWPSEHRVFILSMSGVPVCNGSIIQRCQKPRQGIKSKLETGKRGQLMLYGGNFAQFLVDIGGSLLLDEVVPVANGLFE